MVTFFMFCAVIGGTVLSCQFVLTLIGLGGDHGGDLGGDLGGDAGGIHGGDDGALADDFDDVFSPEGHDAAGHHGSTWLFGVLSFRTLVAATTFFGLGGIVAESLEQTPPVQILVAAASGIAAMYAVHAILQLFARLTEDGTVRIQRAVGREGTVYLTIPPARNGVGKVTLNLQDRLMEYPAVTAGDEALPTGSKVVVTAIVGKNTLDVVAVRQQAQVA